MPRTCNAPVPVGAGALLCLRAGEVALGWGAGLVTTDSRGGAGLGRRVAGEAPVVLPVAVSGEAALVRIMVRYILERHRSERSAGFTCGVGCLLFCWTLDS